MRFVLLFMTIALIAATSILVRTRQPNLNSRRTPNNPSSETPTPTPPATTTTTTAVTTTPTTSTTPTTLTTTTTTTTPPATISTNATATNETIVEEYRNKIKTLFEMEKNVNSFNDEDCSLLRGPPGIFKIVKFQDMLIGASDDNVKLFEMKSGGPNNTKSGSILLIDLKNNNITDIPIENFPSGKAFHPYGMYLFKDFLYVINNAYGDAGTNIEVLRISKGDNNVKLKYHKTITLNKEFVGIVNDIAVIGDNDQFYITTNRRQPDISSLGRNITESYKVDILSNLAAGDKETFVYFCEGADSRNRARCTKVRGTQSLMNTGIVFTPDGFLYVGNHYEKLIRIYEINKRDKAIVKDYKNVTLDYAPLNLYYESNSGIIWVGLTGKIYETQTFINQVNKDDDIPADISMWGGSATIDTKTNNTVKLQVMQNRLYGVSTATYCDKDIVMGSWWDRGVVVCKMPTN